MINTVILMGRMTADAEVRTTSSGVSFCRFTVAVERRSGKSGQERVTDFIRCAAWRERAEFIGKYFRKGRMIAVRGELQQQNYQDQHGNKVSTYEVVVSEISFCGDKSTSNQAGEQQSQTRDRNQRQQSAGAGPQYDEYGYPLIYDESDLPF